MSDLVSQNVNMIFKSPKGETVHALKDMPSNETEGLITNCFLTRNDPREILISKDNKHIKDLASNSIVGTSSLRREFQLKKIR